MFEQTFVDGTTKTKKKYTIILSFVFFRSSSLRMASLIPLIYTQTLPNAQLKEHADGATTAAASSAAASSGAPKVIPKPVVRQFVNEPVDGAARSFQRPLTESKRLPLRPIWVLA